MMPVEPHTSALAAFLTLVINATSCRDPALPSYEASCDAEAVAACAWLLSVTEGRGDPEAACIYVCDRSRRAKKP